ncbi:hypothetical protein LTR36_000770 [Oleoguttula mirabilis]|uniref:Uncharacterized protein n=1 Tax=Oleoguttula mirabilis TaxID=1507867 RepID=A0AAV9J3B0_9PEZI|nr:hypothetical protein LTR36_000770 [Oleoguttula mirabilis]
MPGAFDFGDDPALGFADTHPFLYGAMVEPAANEPMGDMSFFSEVDLSAEPYDLAIGDLTTGYINEVDSTKALTALHAAEPIAQQSARLILQALCAIPEQMSRRETFPAFIHPHWESPALPESLAICMRIAQMFASRTPDITPFIWRTILAEQRHVMEQLPTLSKLDVHAASQAHMVYLIMRVVDGVAEDVAWNQEMTLSLRVHLASSQVLGAS